MPRAETWRPTALVLALLASACTPRAHALRPYRDDPAAAAALEQRAVEACRARQVPLPPAPFRTDGCSAWLDDGWVDCCVTHDMAYWCGGSAAERTAADRALERCVAASGAHVGPLMYAGVRVGAMGWLPFPWRWGYGWPWLGAP
jgi:hypothetical protein